MKFKFLFLIISVLLLVNSVTAVRYVNYNFKEGIISESGQLTHTIIPVTNAGVLGYRCLDASCSTIGEKIFDSNSLSSDTMQLTYPTQKPNYGYALYFYKLGYITWEQYDQNPFYGTPEKDPQGPYTIYLSKKQNCQSIINSLTISGNDYVNNPIIINTNIQSPTSNFGPLEYTPIELQPYYQTNVLTRLEIYDNLNNLIYTENQILAVNPSSTNDLTFTWIPTNYGDYKALIKTTSPDSKCSSSIENTREEFFTVLNQAPIVLDIPDQTIDEGSSFIQINLDDYVSDIDNLDSEITWTYSGNSELSVNINNRIATITAPNENWYGSETITFRATDPNNLYDEDSATFTVNSVDDPAVWQTLENKAIDEDSPDNTIVYQDLLLQCTDLDNSINMQITSTHTNYDLSFSGNDLIINNLEENYYGIEIVELDCNGIPNSFVLTISPVNDAPIANDDSYGINEDVVLNVPAPGVLANDNDIENDPLTTNLVNDVTNGILNLNSDGSFVYTPNSGFNGVDSFTYIATDGNLNSNTATVTILVNSINDAPVANNIISNTNENTEIILTLDYSDIDINDEAESCSILNIIDGTISQPCACNNGICTVGLTPLPNSVADILADYVVNDGDSDSNIATITITVNSINQAPVVLDIPDQTIDEVSSFTQINLDDYVTELDGDNIIWSHAGETDLTVNIDINNIVTITAPQGWAGSETITFTATDNNSEALFDSDDATFTINLLPINTAPTIISSPVTTAILNQQYTYDVEATDPENDPLTYSLTTAPTGMTIDSNTGLIQWAPTSTGAYNVEVHVEDEHGAFDTQLYNIQVSSTPVEPTKQYAKKHLFSINSVSLPLNTYNNGDTIDGFIQLRNLGHLKEKKISGEVSIPSLGIVEQIPSITLGVYDTKWIPFEIKLPDNIKDGEYLIKIELKNSKYTATRFSTFMVENAHTF